MSYDKLDLVSLIPLARKIKIKILKIVFATSISLMILSVMISVNENISLILPETIFKLLNFIMSIMVISLIVIMLHCSQWCQQQLRFYFTDADSLLFRCLKLEPPLPCCIQHDDSDGEGLFLHALSSAGPGWALCTAPPAWALDALRAPSAEARLRRHAPNLPPMDRQG